MTGRDRDNGLSVKAAVRHAHMPKPVTVMLLAAAAAAVLLGTLAGFLLYPAAKEQRELERRYMEKSAALTAEMRRKASEVVDTDELAALLRRVPTRPEREAFILALREIGRRSGVEIISLSSGAGASAPAVGLPGVVGDLAEGLGEAREQRQQSAAGQPGGNGVYEEIRYELEITGTWKQAAEFARMIGELERLVTIPEWRIAAHSPDASWSARPMTMTMTLALYAGTGYEGKFPGVTEDGGQGGDDG
jgi:Tfp pilus assembly protein PilO